MQVNDAPKRINGSLKKVWRVLEEEVPDDGRVRWPEMPKEYLESLGEPDRGAESNASSAASDSSDNTTDKD